MIVLPIEDIKVQFLKRLLGGAKAIEGDRGLYFYVRPKACNEILKVRVDPMNDISQDDDGRYFVRKLARGNRCPFPVEMKLYFDANRHYVDGEIENGIFVSADDYEAWLSNQARSGE